jgi:hypothetical protein
MINKQKSSLIHLLSVGLLLMSLLLMIFSQDLPVAEAQTAPPNPTTPLYLLPAPNNFIAGNSGGNDPINVIVYGPNITAQDVKDALYRPINYDTQIVSGELEITFMGVEAYPVGTVCTPPTIPDSAWRFRIKGATGFDPKNRQNNTVKITSLNGDGGVWESRNSICPAASNRWPAIVNEAREWDDSIISNAWDIYVKPYSPPTPSFPTNLFFNLTPASNSQYRFDLTTGTSGTSLANTTIKITYKPVDLLYPGRKWQDNTATGQSYTPLPGIIPSANHQVSSATNTLVEGIVGNGFRNHLRFWSYPSYLDSVQANTVYVAASVEEDYVNGACGGLLPPVHCLRSFNVGRNDAAGDIYNGAKMQSWKVVWRIVDNVPVHKNNQFHTAPGTINFETDGKVSVICIDKNRFSNYCDQTPGQGVLEFAGVHPNERVGTSCPAPYSQGAEPAWTFRTVLTPTLLINNDLTLRSSTNGLWITNCILGKWPVKPPSTSVRPPNGEYDFYVKPYKVGVTNYEADLAFDCLNCKNVTTWRTKVATPSSTVFGQDNFISNMANRGGSVSANTVTNPNIVVGKFGGNYITDFPNNRVLFYKTGSNTAFRVYGQAGSYTTNIANKGGISANSLNNPAAAAVDNNGGLYIADYSNHRVLYYPPDADGIAQTTATRVYGQGGSFTTNTANKGGISANSLSNPEGVTVDSNGNVYIADNVNNRVLYYPAGSTTATRVYGQGGVFNTNISNKGGISANSLYQPSGGMAIDSSGGLYVADAFNHRVLYYPAGNTTASRVYGQGGIFNTAIPNKGGVSANSLLYPEAVTIDNNGGGIYIADGSNHRVLYFITDGNTTADKVYGQSGVFTTNAVNKNGLSATSLNFPVGVNVDASGAIYIADAGNNRVLRLRY